MDIILIILSWILALSMLYQLYKIRKELEDNKIKNNKRQNIVYVLLVLLLLVFILWGIQRN